MKRNLKILGLPVISINSAYYADRRHGYKAEVKDWISQVCHQMRAPKNKQALSDLHNHFDSKKHSFTVYIKYTTPKYFNKQGTISRQSIDVGNANKVLLDVLFTNDFYGNSSMQCENINHDDTFISALMVKKVPGPEYEIDVTVKIIPLPKN